MKYLKRYNESNFFKGESEDKITLSDIDELKDLFIEFCDEYDFTLRKLDSDIFDTIAGRLVINKIMCNSNLMDKQEMILFMQTDELIYMNHIFSDEKDGDYIMFSLVIGNRSNEELRGIFSLSNDIYVRVLDMGYKCDINLFTISNSMDLFLKFRIGNQLNSVNNIKGKFRY